MVPFFGMSNLEIGATELIRWPLMQNDANEIFLNNFEKNAALFVKFFIEEFNQNIVFTLITTDDTSWLLMNANAVLQICRK